VEAFNTDGLKNGVGNRVVVSSVASLHSLSRLMAVIPTMRESGAFIAFNRFKVRIVLGLVIVAPSWHVLLRGTEPTAGSCATPVI